MVGSAGGDWREYRAVKIDIHQTMVKAHHSPDLGTPEPGAVEFIKDLQKRGVAVWLSCGGFRPPAADYKQKVKLWLARHGIDPDKDIYFLPDQKYIIDISDRAIPFTDWPAARKEAERRLAELERTHNPDPS